MQKITDIVRLLTMLEEKDCWKCWWFELKNGSHPDSYRD